MYDNEFGTAKKAQNTLSVEYCHYHKVSDVKQQSIQFLNVSLTSYSVYNIFSSTRKNIQNLRILNNNQLYSPWQNAYKSEKNNPIIFLYASIFSGV